MKRYAPPELNVDITSSSYEYNTKVTLSIREGVCK